MKDENVGLLVVSIFLMFVFYLVFGDSSGMDLFISGVGYFIGGALVLSLMYKNKDKEEPEEEEQVDTTVEESNKEVPFNDKEVGQMLEAIKELMEKEKLGD